MAIYRNVQIDYWQDGFILDLTPEEKYFYIYLLTNSKTTQCGIYELPKRIIETETGYNRETVEKLLTRFEKYNKIVYSNETKEIFIKNWIKYNKASSPKVKKCIEKEILRIKNQSLIEMFSEQCEKQKYSLDIDVVKNEDKIHLIHKYKLLYEQNVGLINGIVGQWLFEISETVDYELFKHSIEIATNKGKCNKGYINGILKQWNDNNIKSINDLKAYEVRLKNRGEENGKYNDEHSKSKYATASENEDDGLYRKPTDEEIQSARLEFEQFRN